ncbi:MAG: prepilin-type N-terminal cleavage/methylation domain-containing protein [Candidatus Delongbacteria bacterium]|nr:prepilin-type N-terminal cleavage/methylation domain-containing protein [Candidatus Delongbacteria bacterium]MBN2834593.1 prepilin-type N-terminal cleavage/methylation domain-containing protein [Candidatus Delongbacteria bacterium]
MKKGVTLIEVLVSITILAIVVAAGFQIYITNLRISVEQDKYYNAENILRQCVEELTNKPTLLDDNTKWIADDEVSGRINYYKTFDYKGLDGTLTNFSVQLDTVIVKSGEGADLARAKQLKANIKWGKNLFSATTIIPYDYPRPSVSI